MNRAKKAGIVAGGVVGVAVGVGVFRRLRAKVEEEVEELKLAEGTSFEVTSDDGAVIGGVVLGEGPTVVLCHGWTATRLVWAPVAARLLERGYQVVLYDQRGHGRSTFGEATPTVAMLGADLRAVLEKVGVDDAVVVGHSMGGMAVQALAIDHPDVVADRVKALVLVSTAAAGVAGPPGWRLSRAVVGNAGIERLLNGRFGHVFIRPSAGKKISRLHLMATRDSFTGTPASVRVAWLRAMQAMDLRTDLRTVAAPTTVLVGTRDIILPTYLARAVVANLPGARLIRVPGAGHHLPFERPDVVAEAIIEAVETGRSAPGAVPSPLDTATGTDAIDSVVPVGPNQAGGTG